MSLTAFFREVRRQWRTFVQEVWPEETAEGPETEQGQLAREIELRGRRLVALRGRIDRLLERLGRQQGRLRELSARLIHRDASVSAAWERLQQRVEARRLAVAALERRYQERCADLDQLRQARRALA